MRLFCLLAILYLMSEFTFAQKGMTTVGLQIKPILPLTVTGSNKQVSDTSGVHFERELLSGINFGVVVRHNFSSLVAIETGINYIKRKYALRIAEGNYSDYSEFRIIGYEIPIMFMMYSRMAENFYINGSLGPTLDMFASHIETRDLNFQHVAFRNKVFMPALAANVGVEYRTANSGNFYIGASFQRPFEYIYLSRVGFYKDRQNDPLISDALLSGTYLTLDIRYFFPETKRRAGYQFDE